MPLIGIPETISPELLYALAKMGHGDSLVIADANYPSDQIAKVTSFIEFALYYKLEFYNRITYSSEWFSC